MKSKKYKRTEEHKNWGTEYLSIRRRITIKRKKECELRSRRKVVLAGIEFTGWNSSEFWPVHLRWGKYTRLLVGTRNSGHISQYSMELTTLN